MAKIYIPIKKFSDLLKVGDQQGIITRVTYIIGEPSETEEDLKSYGDSFKKITPDAIGIKLLTLFPGTPLFKEYQEKGLLLVPKYRIF